MPKVIVIDPGHGGPDPGSIEVDGRPEKLFTLALATAVRDALVTGFDCRVVLTREDDNSVAGPKATLAAELSARAEVANQASADLFLSLHHDSAGSPNARGASLYVWTDKRTPEGGLVWLPAEDNHKAPLSYEMAQRVYPVLKDALAAYGVPWRGSVMCADFGVLRDADCPGMLLEAFFGTSPADLEAARQPSFIPDLAAAIAQAVAVALELPAKPAAPVPAPADPPPVTVILGAATLPGPYQLIDSRAVGPIGPLVDVLVAAGWSKVWDQETHTLRLTPPVTEARPPRVPGRGLVV